MAEAYNNNDSLSAFINSIQSYLIGVNEDVQQAVKTNVWRNTLISNLYRISWGKGTDEEKAILAIECLIILPSKNAG